MNWLKKNWRGNKLKYNKQSHQQAYKERRFLEKFWEHHEIVCIYESKRTTLLRLMSIFIFMTLLVSTYNSLTMAVDEFSSLQSALFWRFLFILIPAILMSCMLWLSGKYVLMLELMPGKRVRISTWNILGGQQTRIWNAVDIVPEAKMYEGQTEIITKPKVNAPYLIFSSVNGKKLLLDLQGELPYGIRGVLRLVDGNVK